MKAFTRGFWQEGLMVVGGDEASAGRVCWVVAFGVCLLRLRKVAVACCEFGGKTFLSHHFRNSNVQSLLRKLLTLGVRFHPVFL